MTQKTIASIRKEALAYFADFDNEQVANNFSASQEKVKELLGKIKGFRDDILKLKDLRNDKHDFDKEWIEVEMYGSGEVKQSDELALHRVSFFGRKFLDRLLYSCSKLQK